MERVRFELWIFTHITQAPHHQFSEFYDLTTPFHSFILIFCIDFGIYSYVLCYFHLTIYFIRFIFGSRIIKIRCESLFINYFYVRNYLSGCHLPCIDSSCSTNEINWRKKMKEIEKASNLSVFLPTYMHALRSVTQAKVSLN